jgi:hypothetical protein
MTDRTAGKPATAARMYDYYLGGIHNFPADREAAREVVKRFPFIPAAARANRAFLGRGVRYLARAGIHQFLDIGSGIPTVGNVHEVAQEIAPDARVVYVDIDPVAVAESLDLLAGNERAVAVRGDLRSPDEILAHPQVRGMLDFAQPVGVLLAAVLHFVTEDDLAYGAVERLLGAAAPGSYLLASHVATEVFQAPGIHLAGADEDVYQRRTATPGTIRTRPEVQRFFTGLELVDPGVVWVHEWRPDGDDLAGPVDVPHGSGLWAGVGRKP